MKRFTWIFKCVIKLSVHFKVVNYPLVAKTMDYISLKERNPYSPDWLFKPINIAKMDFLAVASIVVVLSRADDDILQLIAGSLTSNATSNCRRKAFFSSSAMALLSLF
jgi:hypothetical protein